MRRKEETKKKEKQLNFSFLCCLEKKEKNKGDKKRNLKNQKEIITLYYTYVFKFS